MDDKRFGKAVADARRRKSNDPQRLFDVMAAMWGEKIAIEKMQELGIPVPEHYIFKKKIKEEPLL